MSEIVEKQMPKGGPGDLGKGVEKLPKGEGAPGGKVPPATKG